MASSVVQDRRGALSTESTDRGARTHPAVERTVHASAHGKLILLGEHSVVYGKSALAFGVANALNVHLQPEDSGLLALHVPAWSLETTERDRGKPAELLRFLRTVLAPSRGYRMIVDTWLPCKAGLGSSAALCSGTIKALNAALGMGLDDHGVNNLARDAEMIFHGKASGIDNTTSIFGGACLFLGNGSNKAPAGFSKLGRSMPNAYVALHARLELVVADTGIKRETKKVVNDVAELAGRDPDGFAGILERMDGLAVKGAAACAKGDLETLGSAMTENHELLRSLDVSHPVLDELVERAIEAGALGAKLTGAGRGGCAVALLPSGAPDVADRVFETWEGMGVSCWVIRNGMEGARQ